METERKETVGDMLIGLSGVVMFLVSPLATFISYILTQDPRIGLLAFFLSFVVAGVLQITSEIITGRSYGSPY